LLRHRPHHSSTSYPHWPCPFRVSPRERRCSWRSWPAVWDQFVKQLGPWPHAPATRRIVPSCQILSRSPTAYGVNGTISSQLLKSDWQI
jgi:hypothetical protein